MSRIYKQALSRFGLESQIRMAVEECGELIVSLSHLLRGKCFRQDVAEEIADVEIMMAQMRIVIGNDLVDMVKAEKLERLKGILEGGGES